MLFCRTCLRPVQQSRVGALASPPTYGRHVASPTSWSAHSALSWSKFELPKPASSNTKVNENAKVALFEPIAVQRSQKEMEIREWDDGRKRVSLCLFMLGCDFIECGGVGKRVE